MKRVRDQGKMIIMTYHIMKIMNVGGEVAAGFK